MAISQNLTLTAVENSANESKNTSRMRILWESTQSGDSGSAHAKNAYYFVSVNGGAEIMYGTTYTLPKNTTVTVLDRVITVDHNAQGVANVSVRVRMDTGTADGVIEQMKTINLPAIDHRSEITFVSNITLGERHTVKWVPKSSAYGYEVEYKYGEEVLYRTHDMPGKTTEHTFTTNYTLNIMEIGRHFPDSRTGTMSVTLYTYADRARTQLIGASESRTFTVTFPDSANYAPMIWNYDMVPFHSLPDVFDGLYIQGFSRVRVTCEIQDRSGSSGVSAYITVDGKNRSGSAQYTSDLLTNHGSIPVSITARDARGLTTTRDLGDITVIGYSKPTVGPASGQSKAVAARCDADGNLSDSGTYLKIMAKRNYSRVVSSGVQKNFCQLRYRYKLESAESYSQWTTILARESIGSDEVITGALLSGALAVKSAYKVQIQAIDDIGRESTVTVDIPTDKIFMHRDGAIQAIAFGKYVEEENCIDIAKDIKVRFRSDDWVDIGLSDDVVASRSAIGRGPEETGCFYRVVNGNHVYVAFNCQLTVDTDAVRVNANAIPEGYRPLRDVYALCATATGPIIAEILVNKQGEVLVKQMWNFASPDTQGAFASGMDGYIDYFVM